MRGTLNGLGVIAVVAAMCPASAANAQLTMTGQDRSISISSTSTDPAGGQTVTPPPTAATAGDYSPQAQELVAVSRSFFGMANTTSAGAHSGGFNGTDTIILYAMDVSVTGSCGPFSSGGGEVRNTFSYTFTVAEQLTYRLDGQLGAAAPIVAHARFTGPSGDLVSRNSLTEPGSSLVFNNVTGTLEPGSYTLAVWMQGQVSYVGLPTSSGESVNVRGTGATDPFSFRLTVSAPAVCRADFNASGAVDVADIFSFLSAWFAQSPGSDFDSSGATDVADIFAFLSAWFAGCG